MTLAETRDFFKMIVALYPRDSTFAAAPVEAVRAWHMMLDDILPDIAAAALKAHSSTSPFPPSIAEIRQFAAKAQNPMMDADEAYKLARDARRKYGYYQGREAMDSLPEPVRDAIKTCYGTFCEWCMSTEPDGVERAQFMRIYDAQKSRIQQAAALPPSVTELQKRLAGNIGLLEG